MQSKHLKIGLLASLLIGLSACKALREMPSKTREYDRKRNPQFEHEVLEDKEQSSSSTEEDDSEVSSSSIASEYSGKLESFINDWYGTPHRMGGMTKKGVDCSGFVIIAYREVFNREFRGRRAEDLFSEMKALDRDELEYGDLVFFKVRGRRIDHVGIYLGKGDFAHTSSSRGVMISNLSNVYWSKRYFKGARYKS